MKKTMRLLTVMFVVAGLASCNASKEDKEGAAGEKDTVKSEKSAGKPTPLADGMHEENYPDGKLKIKGEVRNGTRFGLWQAFYPDGTKQSEDYFEDGKKNGKTATFYKNGKIRYIGYYTWDKPSGSWEFYSEEGELVSTKEYK